MFPWRDHWLARLFDLTGLEAGYSINSQQLLVEPLLFLTVLRIISPRTKLCFD